MAERPTPLSISVGILIALQSDPTSPLNQELNPSSELQHNLSAFLQEFVLNHPSSTNAGWSSVQGMSLSRFFSQLKALSDGLNDDDALCPLVFDYVNLAASSLDSLVDLMDSLRAAITEGLVDGTSACGMFLRKVCLGFDQLSFETTALLWSDLQEEMKLAVQSLEEGTNDNTNRNNAQDDDRSYWPLSASQMETALRRECFCLGGISNREDEDLSFEEMEVKLRQVLSHDPELPAAHFLRFLNCVKHGERVGALDSLHQYFDYAIIQGTKGKPQDILQFAAILLASLHSSFGDSALAKMATDEAVRVAQQSMDAACVAFALGWIFSNEQQEAGGGLGSADSAGDLLQRCASRAQEGGIFFPLVAGANLSLTKYHISGAEASSGETHTPRGLADLAWRSIADAASDRPAAEAVDDGTIDRPTHMTDTSSSREAMDTLARQKLVSAGVWDYFGQVALSGISSFIALYCHADQMLSHDVVTAIQNIARTSLYGSPSVLLSGDFDGTVLEKHMEELKNKTPKSEKPSDSKAQPFQASTTCSIYGDAVVKLISLWKLFRLPMDGVFLINVTMVLHEWAIRRGEIQQAIAFGAALESYLHPRLPNYWQVMIDIFSQKSLLLSRQRKWSEAKELIHEMIEVAKTNNLKTHHASLLLQLAVISLEENPHECTSALTPRLLECLTMTTEMEMDGLHATALSVLAQVHLRMKNPNRSIAVLQASLPSLLQQEHVWFQAEAFLTLAKSRLQLAKGVDKQSTTSKNPSLVRLLKSALKDLEQSQSFFRKCQDCAKLREVYYLEARILNAIPGEQQRRDQAAQSFLDLSKHLACADKPLAYNSSVVSCLSDVSSLEEMTRREVPGFA